MLRLLRVSERIRVGTGVLRLLETRIPKNAERPKVSRKMAEQGSSDGMIPRMEDMKQMELFW